MKRAKAQLRRPLSLLMMVGLVFLLMIPMMWNRVSASKPESQPSTTLFRTGNPNLLQGMPGACTALSFTPPDGSRVGVGSFPGCVGIGDFNSDGKPDLAVGRQIPNNLIILLSNELGGLTPGGTVGVGASPVSIVVSDFNDDDHLDLATVNYNSANVSILLGNGSGGFTQPAGSPIGVGPFPDSLAVGDFNNDDKPDLAVSRSDSITILLGNGSGGFTQPAGSPFGVASGAVAVGHFNNDNNLDLVTANLFDNNVSIFLGNGSGGFTANPSVRTGGGPSSVAVGDFTDDGKADLAVTNLFDNNVSILPGNGLGGFTPDDTPIAVGDRPGSIAVGDFNGNGKPDIAVTNARSNTVSILLSNGSSGFTQAPGSPYQTGESPSSIATGDFDLDNKADLVIVNRDSGTLTFLLATGSGRFQSGSPFDVGNAESIAAGDFNHDDIPDMAISSRGNRGVNILLGNGRGGFTQPTGSPISIGIPLFSVVTADFNGDSNLDLATANSTGSVSILLGNGNGGFTPTAGSPIDVGSNAVSIATGDFNGDGKVDLTTTDFLSNTLTILLGNGNGGFTQPAGSPISVGVLPYSVATGDFNGDNKSDVAVVNQSNNNITILLSNGSGGFTQPAGSPVGAGTKPIAIAAGDFNGDNKADLATVNYGSANVSILLGNGSGGFTQPAGSPIAVGDSPLGVAVGDLNGDGKADLVTTSGNLTILLGNGSGGFTQPAGSPVGAGNAPVFTAIRDFNRDGKADLATANFGDGSVSVLLNTCTPVAPPTILATNLTQNAGSSSANTQIATVDDGQDAENTLAVTIDGGASATVTGVSVDSISVSAAGIVTANVAASCAATTASFTLRVTDSGDLSAEAILTVTVNPDNQPPTIACPANITRSADTGLCTAVVTYTTPTVSDNCSGVSSVTCIPASGSAFPKGTTTVNCSVTDARGNPASCSFTVAIADTQSPTLDACPGNQNVSTASGCVNVTYTPPTVSDNCPGATVACVPPSGTCFAVGTTTVTCTGTDSAGNTAVCDFTITVTPCAITCPANVTAPATSGLCTAMVSYNAPTTIGSCGTVTCSPPSGSTFSKGITTVTCRTQTGPSCSFTVTVNDTQAPQIICPANLTRTTDKGQCQAVVSYANATATDNCSGVGTPVCIPASGSAFAKGVTTVTCTLSDGSGNTATCSFTVTINDSEAPQIICPPNVAVPTATGQCAALVTYALPQVRDNCPNVGTAICSPVSGTSFAKGVTTVTCTVTDSSGNSKSCNFTVTVTDTQLPQISCPANSTMQAETGKCAAIVSYLTTAIDNCPGVTVICNPPSGSSFPKGTTTVMCVATDTSNNSASCSFSVTIIDTQTPQIVCPANQKRVTERLGDATVLVTYPVPTVSDNCSGATVICVPPSGAAFPLGTTTVTCTATDAAGNLTACLFTVMVFDICLQDDSNPLTVLLANSITGEYRFCCAGTSYTGRGTITRRGLTLVLAQTTGQRLNATVDGTLNKGNASLQVNGTTCTITDRDLRNNACQCQ
jgi:hypothetical protein